MSNEKVIHNELFTDPHNISKSCLQTKFMRSWVSSMAKFILVLNMNRIPVFVTPYLCGFYPDLKKKFVGYPAIFLIADKKDKNKKPYYVKAVSLKPKQMCRIFSLKKSP